MKLSFLLFAVASATNARQTNAAEPSMYTAHMFQWGGKGYQNSGAQEMYHPGTCPDPTGQLTIKCSSGELVIVDPSVNPNTFNHNCVMDPADDTKATCSSDGTLRTAAAECRGSSELDLKLQLTLNESTVSCEADGTSAKNMMYLATRCEDWVDLDDECSAVKKDKTNADDSRYVCYHQGYSTCSIWPSMTCTVSVGEVTMTSVGQGDPKCVHSIETATTGAATTTTTTTTPATSSSTSTTSATINNNPVFVEGNGLVLCSDKKTTGYKTWNELKTAVKGTGNKGGIFTICPDSVLKSNKEPDGIEISTQHSVIIRCGDNGSRENNCLFQGPTPRHFSLAFDCCGNMRKLNIKLQGITFKLATHISIYIKPGGYGSYTFEDCAWEGNTGAAGAVYVQPYDVSDVTFRNCDFIRNKAVCGPIRQILSTNMVVDHCLFLENEATAFGSSISSFCAAAIGSSEYGSTLAISNSCFIGNVAKGPAVVDIDDSQPNILRKHDNNYYAENEVGTAGPWIEYSNAPFCPTGVYVDEFDIVDSWCKGKSQPSCPLSRITHPPLTTTTTTPAPKAPREAPDETTQDLPPASDPSAGGNDTIDEESSGAVTTFSFMVIFQLLALCSIFFVTSVCETGYLGSGSNSSSIKRGR